MKIIVRIIAHSHLDSSVKNQFHNELKNVVIMLSNVPDWQKLKETYLNGATTESGTSIKGIEAVNLKFPQRSGTFYDLSVAQGLMDSLVNFFDSFAPILKNVFIGSSNMQNEFIFNANVEISTLITLFLFFIIPFLSAILIPVWKVAIIDSTESMK